MVNDVVNNMTKLVNELKESIKQDITDIKAGKNEALLERNDHKHDLINEIASLKSDLNRELISEMKEGVDVNIYRDQVDALEDDLKELYELNKKLASIVLPIKQMYSDLVDEITVVNGGQIFDVKA
ncbi:hypothetical protein [Arcobacter roscoffensis]|uniref:Flagellar protein FlgN n=1 Tax=Arcobacter roscoffensis TaxID=2961520 RepID=A0ABY5E4G4_9BACT|nr:hypothetical protein [Arcobacter roscoffensis]UTJ05973.1 hypothetical protein NJU99_12040 [Arcobacter roscoffensis]